MFVLVFNNFVSCYKVADAQGCASGVRCADTEASSKMIENNNNSLNPSVKP